MYESSQIPLLFPIDIWPGIADEPATVALDMRYSFELPFGERALLSGLVKMRKPQMIFEFGTFTGSTTLLLADASPVDCIVHTIDLPDSAFPPNGFDNWFTSALVGTYLCLADRKRSDKVIAHRADLDTFDFTEFEAQADLVFVDADHSYESVLRDSQTAFRIVKPAGTIIWDDYHPSHWGSVRALNEIAQDNPLVRVGGTRLVACQLNHGETRRDTIPTT